ncbi:MAG: PspC domain-containing protein, partial [Solirubrobacterales bacterium]|nr:PspC domain-containing protein [Solirubrobacterales bacterium]
DPAHGVLGGVCAGLASSLGVDPLLLRVAFIVITVAGGLGVPLYLVLWAALPAGDGAPSLGARLRGRPGSWQVAAGVGCLALALLLTARELGFWWSDAVIWPVVLALSGAALVWRQATLKPSAPPAPERPRDRGEEVKATVHGLRGVYRGGFGIALIVGAALLILQTSGALTGARDAVLGVLVTAAAIALVSAPFWWRLVRGLDAERAERIRSQERAEVAAHLHDSVLQTLALVQKRAEDPKAVAALARRQERELRAWLSGAPEARPDERLADALRAAAAEAELEHGAEVEVVTVGDRELDDASRALVAAAREAIGNAVRHAGGPVTVYAEVEDGRTEVFVRDRGAGFDPAAIPADRRGVRESIIGRMARHGGRAQVHSAPGAGTEIELVLEEQR